MTRQHAARWYVYQLVDPRDGKPFYIGKGTGRRMYAHEAEAAKGVCSRKTRRINELRSLGAEVQKEQIAFFWDEQAAYDFETEVISEIGLDALTNVMPGGQKAWERRCVELAGRARQRKPFSLYDWIAGAKDAVLVRVAEWLRAGAHEGGVVKCEGGYAFTRAVTEGFYNTLLPAMWRQVCADDVAFRMLGERLKPYGVEFSYGSP